jgi:hypothetical protein
MPAVRVPALAILLALLSMRADVTRQLVLWRIVDSNTPDPCFDGVPTPDPAFLERIWRKYGLTLPECSAETDSESRPSAVDSSPGLGD